MKDIFYRWAFGAMALIAVAIIPAAASADHTTEHTIEQLRAQIEALRVQIEQLLQQQPPVVACSFLRNLSLGSAGEDVRCLQQFLNGRGFTLASTGPGSPGNETVFFGPRTQLAVIRWQEANSAQVLVPVGLARGTGFWGPSSQAHYRAILGIGGEVPPPPPPAGTRLTVAPATPHTFFALAPQGAARVPFTRVTLSAAGSDVTVSFLTVERQGFANDAAFERIVLIDEATGFQIGLGQTLNAEHRATFTEPVIVRAGQSRTITIAANMASDLSPYQGQVGRLALVALNAPGVTVSGTLPVVGNDLTLNSTLNIGTLTLARGAADPGVSQTREVGLANFAFAAVRATAGSAEDVTLESVRFNQAGSAASGDLANVRVIVDGVSRPATVSADGKFYSARFEGGIRIPKGTSKEIALVADIASGSGRTISFDIQRKTDIAARGNTFGYHLTAGGGAAGAAAEGSFSSNLEPFYNAYTVTVSQGSLRVERSGAVPAGNVAINVSDTPLGAFLFEARGEPAQISNAAFTITVTGSGSASDITLVSIVDENGAVVAGPVTPSGSTATFTSGWTVPTGSRTYIIRGRLSTAFATGDTITLSVTPSAITARGEVTGSAITPTPSAAVSANTQTVRGTALTVAVSETPAAQTVVAGTSGFTLARYQFDATASGEDIRVTSLRLRDTYAGSPGTNDLQSCQLFDGSAALNTGGNVVHPALDATSPDDFTFTLDNPLVITKGTFKTIDLKCTITSNAASGSSHRWGINSGVSGNVVASGAQTGLTVTPNVVTGLGQTMTVGVSGPLSVSADASSPAERLAIAGTADAPISVLRFEARNEAIRLEQLGLTLTGSGATTSDIGRVSLWDGATRVGETVFVTNATSAVLTLSQPVTIPANSSKALTVRADLAAIGPNQPGVTGHQIEINYDGVNNLNTRGVGLSSGQAINPPAGASTAAKGVRVVKTMPTVEIMSIPTNTLTNGDMILYRFRVTAGSEGDAGLYKFTFSTATTGVTLSDFSLHGYSDAAFSAIGHARNPLNSTASSADSNGIVEIYFNPVAQGANEAVQVPAGQTRYYELRATVAGASSGDSATVRLDGDAAWLASAFSVSAAGVDADAHDDFIWSPNSTTTAGVADADWVNGFLLPGLPSTNAQTQTLSR